ncbi:MAG TPA: VCBS repeat-containing protein [Iamia sp.]
MESVRRVAVVLAGLALVTGGLVVTPSPAGAAPADSDTLVFVPFRGQSTAFVRNGAQTTTAYLTSAFTHTGDFTGGAGTDVLLYNPGSDPDGIIRVTPSGTGVTTSLLPKSVHGQYSPLIGDFDGNAIDDILWYAPGVAADSLWLFAASGAHTSTPVTINGSYSPTVIEMNGDGRDDILWYGTGAAADSIWLFGSGASHTTKSVSISGEYRLVPGHFGLRPEGSPQERLLFYAPVGPDSIWTFDTAADHTSAPVPNVEGVFEPLVGRFTDLVTDAILWYRFGSGSERFWSFTDAGAVNQLEPPTVNGSYDTAVGDYDGNGYQDIAWEFLGDATIWQFNGGGFSQTSVSTGLPNTVPVTGFTDPFDL